VGVANMDFEIFSKFLKYNAKTKGSAKIMSDFSKTTAFVIIKIQCRSDDETT